MSSSKAERLPIAASQAIPALRKALTFRSIRFRLTGLFVLIFGTTLILFSALLYSAFVRSHQAEFDAALYNHAIDVAEGVEVNLFGDLIVKPGVLSSGGKIFPFSVGRTYTEIRDPAGGLLAPMNGRPGSELPFDQNDLRELAGRRAVFKTIDRNGAPYRKITYVMRMHDDTPVPPKLILQIAAPMGFLERERTNLIAFFGLAIPLTLVIAMFGGLYLSRRALIPVSDIIEKARGISVAHLSERVPVPPVRDEIQQLALTLNELLDRLQQAFESQERFVADASHQLKTPLSILRGELDVLSSRNDRTPEELGTFLKSASEEVDYLSRMVEDLLLLARVDAGIGSLSIAEVRLDEVALEAIARLEGFARKRQVKIRLDLAEPGNGTGYDTRGDSDLLQCMLQNLIENAVKFSPEGASVEVSLEPASKGGMLQIAVKDHGPGIPADQVPKIFERFFRVQETRGKVSGLGLGLPIARRICEVHGGDLEVVPPGPFTGEPQGAKFIARIKKV